MLRRRGRWDREALLIEELFASGAWSASPTRVAREGEGGEFLYGGGGGAGSVWVGSSSRRALPSKAELIAVMDA